MSALLQPPTAAYVHIPFCRKRCFYCDFPIQVVGAKPNAADAAAEAYCELLHREMAATPSGASDAMPLRSLYFGGGTPSLTPPAQLSKVIEGMRSRYGFAADCEITLEMDPGTFDASRLAAFRASARGSSDASRRNWAALSAALANTFAAIRGEQGNAREGWYALAKTAHRLGVPRVLLRVVLDDVAERVGLIPQIGALLDQ